MIDITHKPLTLRYAKAEGWLEMQPATLQRIKDDKVAKGNVQATARVAGIESAKRTSDWIIFTHPIPLDGVEVYAELENGGLHIIAEVQSVWKTGVEIEAITAVTGALLNALDMLKPYDTNLRMTNIQVTEKRGGTNDFKDSFDPPLTAAVLVISDSTFAGNRKDKSGKIIKEMLQQQDVSVEVYDVLPDDEAQIKQRVTGLIEDKIQLIITTGGTGFGPKDMTPEALRDLIDKPAPGITERMRSYGSDRTPYAMLSREIAGIAGQSLILTLPGSSKGARESMQALFPGVLHLFRMMWGGGHSPNDDKSKI